MKDDVRIRDLSQQTYFHSDIQQIIRVIENYPDIFTNEKEAISAMYFIKRIDCRRTDTMTTLHWLFNNKPYMFIHFKEAQCTMRKIYTKLILVNGMGNNLYFRALPKYLKTWIFDKLIYKYCVSNIVDEKFYGQSISVILREYFINIDTLKDNFDLDKIIMTELYVTSLYNITCGNYIGMTKTSILYNLYMEKFRHNIKLKKIYKVVSYNDSIYMYTTSKLGYFIYSKIYKIENR